MSISKKIVSIIVTVSFLFTNLTYSYASSIGEKQDKLAAASRLQEYLKKQQDKNPDFPKIDPMRLTMVVSALNKAFHEDRNVKQAIKEQNQILNPLNIRIEEEPRDDPIKGATLKYLVFHFGTYQRRAYFLVDPRYPLGHPVYKKIRVLTEKDKSALSIPGVEGVWFTKHDGVTRRRFVAASLAGLFGLTQLGLLASCVVGADFSGKPFFDKIQITDPGDTRPTFLGSEMPSSKKGSVSIDRNTILHSDDNGSVKVDFNLSDTQPVNEITYRLRNGDLSKVDNLNILVQGERRVRGEFELHLIDQDGEVVKFIISGLTSDTGLVQIPLGEYVRGAWADDWFKSRGGQYVDISKISEIKMIFHRDRITPSQGSINSSGIYRVTEKEETEKRESVTASEVTGDEPVTLLENPVLSDDISQRLYHGPQFVQNNNAPFIYSGGDFHFTDITESDQQDILNNGISYVYNGQNHSIRIIGRDNRNQKIAIVFDTEPETDPEPFDRAYRVSIEPRLIAQQNINRIEEIVFETHGTQDFILNGFQKQYAVLPTSEEATPDIVNPESSTSSEGVTVEATPTAQGIEMRSTMTAGDNGQYASLNIPTRSGGGIPLSDRNLQGAWRMEEGALVTDSGPNGYTLTNVGGVESVSGRFGNAARFTARNRSYLTRTGLHITGDMTVSTWINVNDYPQQGFVIAAKMSGSAGENVDYAFYLEGGTMRSWNGSTNVEGIRPVPNGGWHHVAFVREGSNITFYLDGEPNGTFEQSFPSPDRNAPFYIGHNGLEAYADGMLDELAILDRVLSPEEIQASMNPAVDSSNFLKPTLESLDFRARGNSPFILRLTDDADEELDVFVTGLDPDTMQNITIDLDQARTVMNPAFNLGNVTSVEIRVEDKFLPVADSEELEVFIELEGLIGTPDGTRGEYAYDPDLNRGERGILRSRLQEATTVDHPPIDGHPVIGIRSWGGILTPDGLNFKPADHTFSAFHIGGVIYIPAPRMIMEKILIGGEARDRLREALDKRNNIILHHELHEIKGWNHKQAVLSEFEDDINGLNYADIATILLSVLINNKKVALDSKFHDLFIRALLAEGMPLSYNTYSEILRQTLGIEIDVELYDRIIGTCKGLVRSYIGDRPVDTEQISMADNLSEKVKDEPGYDAFAEAIGRQPQKGTILIDLGRFFVKNDTLSDAVAIDTEYFQRFIHFARNLNPDITLAGITSSPETDISTRQLIDLVRRNLPQHLPEFKTYHEVDFTDYHARLVKEGIDIQSAVTILSEESAGKIEKITDQRKRKSHKELKMIAPFGSGYNRVATVWQEFRIAVEGIGKEKSEFLNDIIAIARELLDDLVARKQIEPETAVKLIKELRQNGIWYVPVYFDPGQYYLSIEQMKTLLTNA